MAVEYAGIYLHIVEDNEIVKLCDSMAIHKTALSVSTSQIKKTIKSLINTMDDGQFEKKTFNMEFSYYIYFHTNIYFVIVARTEINDEGKVKQFYNDLKKDLGPICRGNLASLQDENL